MQACGFCEKYNEKRDQPLKPFRALIEFDFDAKLILDNDFEVLLINPYAQLVGFRLVFVGNPDLSYRPGQIDACRVELVGSLSSWSRYFCSSDSLAGSGSAALPRSDNWRAVKPSSFNRQPLP
jgi:hypothetical protein